MNNILGFYWWLGSYRKKTETIQNSSEYNEIKNYIKEIIK